MEKKKSIGFKKIIVSILSILFVVCAYMPNIPKVNAQQSNVITYNSYGSTERGVDNVAFNGTTYITRSYIRFNFNGNYNGIVGINLSGASPMSAYAILPDNCHIISTSTNYIQIEFYGVNQCEVSFAIASTSGVSGTFDIQSVVWNSMTKVSDSDSAQLVNIKNRLDDLKTYTDAIESLMTTNNQLLQTIANNGGSGGSSTVNNIDINVDHIADELSLLKTSNDSILDELLGFFTDGLGQIITIESVVDAIEDTTTALLGVQNQLTSIGNTLTSINTTLSNINTAVQNIDNSIDTITWNSINSTFVGLSTDNSNYSLSNKSGKNIYLKYTVTNLRANALYKIHIPVYFSRYSEWDIGLYSITGYSYQRKDIMFYVKQNQRSLDVFLWYDGSNLFQDFVILCTNTVASNRSATYVSDETSYIKYIEDTDIEYWNLMTYIDQYNMQRKLLNAINSISVNITQNDINEMNTNINEYNQTMTDINQIENNYINNFNTLNSGIDLTNNATPSIDLINARTQFNSVFNDIIGDLRIRGLLILVLVCGLILILLGA